MLSFAMNFWLFRTGHKSTKWLLIWLISDLASLRHLCSASRRQLLVPRHNLSTYGRRAFCVEGPPAWNCLSDELREPLLTANSFRQLLETRLFVEYSAYSAAELLRIMRCINVLTYQFTYLLTYLRRQRYDIAGTCEWTDEMLSYNDTLQPIWPI